jgi:hypothetical protein
MWFINNYMHVSLFRISGGDPATAIQPQDHAHGPAVSPNPEEHAHNPVHDPPKTEMDDMMENMDDTEDDLAEQGTHMKQSGFWTLDIEHGR